ncbi:MAG: hypothetical protein Q9O24_05135 [Gammaproteobacteria bacterium]|nr:hypothetical protein [Gammaproteobacteria bacterium]
MQIKQNVITAAMTLLLGLLLLSCSTPQQDAAQRVQHEADASVAKKNASCADDAQCAYDAS